MKCNKGFSLIELMVTVMIVGILSAVAIPAYSNYVIRAKVPDATSILASKRVQIEQYYQDNRTYVGAPACNNDTASSKYFTFSCPAATLTATTYVIQAAGNTIGDTSMNGFTYTIANTPTDNLKASTIIAPAPANWRASQAACWITNSGGTC